MTVDLQRAFEAAEDEYIQFDRIENPRHPRPDIAAFLLLSELAPGSDDMVLAAEHDEIYLVTDCEALAEVITQEQVVELARCGVRYDEQYDCLAMFI
jgi:hypothetical protein